MTDVNRASAPVHRQARLWEIDHPYYCSESNYYSRDAGPHDHASWADFMGGIGSMDEDLNLVFRWDWMADETDWESAPVLRDAAQGYLRLPPSVCLPC